MNYWTEFLLVAGAHLLAVASPGPDFAIVVKQSITHGRRVAVLTSIGIGSGIFLHVGYSLLGIGLLVSQSVLWFSVLKYAGAAYLAWVALKALMTRPARGNAASAGATLGGVQPPAAAAPGDRGAFVTGFLINALNPKAAMFFIALFSVVIDPQTPRVVQAGYGLWMAVATMGWFTLVSFFFTREDVRRGFQRAGHWFERAMGLMLLGLAARLAFTSMR